MSGAFLLAADKPSAEPKQEFFGLELSRAARALDRLAARLKVRPLTSFISMDEGDQELLRDLAEEAGADPAAWKPEPVEWYAAPDGLKTVRALLQHLSEHPEAVRKRAAVVRELTALAEALDGIARKKARWRLWIDT
jgi:hypothetical protein